MLHRFERGRSKGTDADDGEGLRVSRPSNGLQRQDRAEPDLVPSDDPTPRPDPVPRPKPFVEFSQGSTAGAAKGMSLAFEFAGAVFLFWLVGRFADTRLGTEPWGQIIGSLIGWLGGFLHVYYKVQRDQS